MTQGHPPSTFHSVELKNPLPINPTNLIHASSHTLPSRKIPSCTAPTFKSYALWYWIFQATIDLPITRRFHSSRSLLIVVPVTALTSNTVDSIVLG